MNDNNIMAFRYLLRIAVGVAWVAAVSVVFVGAGTGGGAESESMHDGVTRMVFIGDSITQGARSRKDDGGFSYRYWLWRSLVDAGEDIDFVGSTNGAYPHGNPGWPEFQGIDFDRDHEGHWGWSSERLLQKLPRWLRGYDADIAVIHLGHNDMRAGVSNSDIGYEGTAANLRGIVEFLREDNPGIVIFLARVIPAASDRRDALHEHIESVNVLVGELALRESRRESPIIVVDLNTGFDSDRWTYDGLHPNAEGERFMAEEIYKAFMESGIIGRANSR